MPWFKVYHDCSNILTLLALLSDSSYNIFGLLQFQLYIARLLSMVFLFEGRIAYLTHLLCKNNAHVVFILPNPLCAMHLLLFMDTKVVYLFFLFLFFVCSFYTHYMFTTTMNLSTP